MAPMQMRNSFHRSSRKLLRILHALLLFPQRKVLRHPKKTIVLFLAVFAVGLLLSARLKMLLVMNDLIDPDFKTYSQLMDLNHSFPDKNNAYVVIRPTASTPLSKKTICDLRAWVQTLNTGASEIDQIVTAFGASRVESSDQSLKFRHILDLNCGDLTDPETEKIKTAFQEIRGTPWGSFLTSKNADDLLLNFYLADTKTEEHLANGRKLDSFDIKTVGALMDNFNKNFLSSHPDVKATWGGITVYQFFLKQGYDKTAALNLLTLTVLSILLRWIFGTWRCSLLFITSYIFAMVPTYAGMALTGAPIDVLTNSLALMVLVSSLEDFLMICYLRQTTGRHWRYPFRKLLVPGFMTSLTTAIGFGSLLTADLAIIRRFGLWAAVAGILEFIAVFYLLPAILQLRPKMRQWTNIKRPGPLWVDQIRRKNLPRWMALASVPLLFLSLFGVKSLVVSDTPQAVFPKSHPVNQALEELEKTRGWQTEISLVFKDKDNQRFNETVLSQVIKHPVVGAIENPYAVEKYFRKGLPEYRGDAVIDLWSQSPVYHRLVSKDGLESRANLYLKDTDINGINAFNDFIQKICAGNCFIAGTLVSYGEFGEKVLTTLISSLGLSLLLVSAVLVFLVLATNTKGLFAILISSIWGPLSLLFLFVVFKIPIFYVTSVFASILIGLAGDNAVQFIFADRRSALHGVQKLGNASVLIVFCMILLTTVLFLSDFEPLKKLGALMITGFFFNIIGDVWVLKALLQKGRTGASHEASDSR